jgi:uncharacterized protein
MSGPGWEPVAERQRITTLDVLRGVAICGMLFANILFFAFPATSRNLMAEGAGAADRLVAVFVGLFVDGKFYTLFSILFGVGLALQSLRAAERDRPFVGVYVRRLVILMLIGIAHGLLFSSPDILAFYAAVAFVALPFRNLRPRALLATAVIVYAIGVLAIGLYAARVPGAALPAEPSWGELVEEGRGAVGASDDAADRASPESASAAAARITFLPLATRLFGVSELELYEFMADEERVFRSGTWSEMVRYRAVMYLAVGVPLRLLLVSWRVLALFLLGIYFVKRALFLKVEGDPGLYRKMAVYGVVVGMALQMVGAGAQSLAGDFVVALAIFLVGVFAGVPALSLGYAGLTALVCARWGESVTVRSLAAVGRTALTNYIGQSVICGLIFYSYGLGLYGQLTGTQAMLIAILILAAQVIASTVWLRYFRFGPLEWAWRSASYWRVQPMRRAV